MIRAYRKGGRQKGVERASEGGREGEGFIRLWRKRGVDKIYYMLAEYRCATDNICNQYHIINSLGACIKLQAFLHDILEYFRI